MLSVYGQLCLTLPSPKMSFYQSNSYVCSVLGVISRAESDTWPLKVGQYSLLDNILKVDLMTHVNFCFVWGFCAGDSPQHYTSKLYLLPFLSTFPLSFHPFLFFFLEISPCNTVWLRTSYEDQDGFRLTRRLPSSVSQKLGLKRHVPPHLKYIS